MTPLTLAPRAQRTPHQGRRGENQQNDGLFAARPALCARTGRPKRLWDEPSGSLDQFIQKREIAKRERSPDALKQVEEILIIFFRPHRWIVVTACDVPTVAKPLKIAFTNKPRERKRDGRAARIGQCRYQLAR